MSPFYGGLVIGLFLGAVLAIFFYGLCIISRDADDKAERIFRLRGSKPGIFIPRLVRRGEN